jgi:Protein of unknown function (DUF4232)
MRFQVVSDPRARSASYHGLTRAATRGRTATVSALAVVACGLVMTACGSQGSPAAASSTSPGSSSAGSSSAASVDACATSQLKVSIVDTGALAGQAGGYLKFTNDSHTACRMSDWPAVTGVTAAGKATRLRNLQSTMFGAWRYTAPPPVITVQPGASAYAVVAADDHPAGSSTRCPAPYVRLRVSPPGGSGNLTISAWLPGARSYLPSCASAKGSPTAGASTITALSSLPH